MNPVNQSAMLEIHDLWVGRAGKTVCRVPELRVERGERVVVIGPNGSGKTTLLRVLAGLEREFTGVCRTALPGGRRVFVHQDPYLFRGTVLYNVRYGLAARNLDRREQDQQARDWLEKLGVGHLVNRQSPTLSAGERRRVALARAFATEADLLLLDEPLADLDEDGVAAVRRAVIGMTRSTFLIASPGPLPAKLGQRIHGLQ